MTDTDLPMSLYKANLEVQTRVSQLLQESAQQWLEMSARLFEEGVADARAGAEQLTRPQDWQSLATVPGEAFWRQWQQRLGDAQATTQVAVATQTAYARGLQEAVREWQMETTRALGGTAGATSVPNTWNDLMKTWQSFLPDAAGLQGGPGKTAGSARRGK